MPLLRRQVFQKASGTERLRDNDEVFFCEQTNEIFSNYEDYFHRVMLISSIVWSCALTGKPNLTYAEALESEKAAKKLLKTFPSTVKGPFLLIASHTKRSSINEMHEDVYGYIKDMLFKGETVEVLDPSGKMYRSAKILEVIVQNTSSKTINPSKTERFKYRVRADQDNLKPQDWIVPGDCLKRDRSATTRDKCKLFLKQHVEAGPGGVLRIKESSFRKFVNREGWTKDQVFFGKIPDFGQSKRLKIREEKQQNALIAAATTKKALAMIGKQLGKKQKRLSKDNKQQSISKYLNKPADETIINDKKTSYKQVKEKMECVQKDKSAFEREAKKQQEEEKAILLQQVAFAIKHYNKTHEDQELSDQRIIPAPKPVITLLEKEYFSEFLYILEFINSFADLISIRDKFPNGLTMDLLERALLLKEVNGPLSDILQVLLSTVFSYQIDEETDVEVRYDRPADINTKRANNATLIRATKTVQWCEKYHNVKLNELPMDSTTISELLRLHFLASGAFIDEKAARYRYWNRGGYVNTDDPGLKMVEDYPHIIQALQTNGVFHLSTVDLLRIMNCLIDQLLTFGSVRDIVEERVEKARTARLQYLSTRAAKRKRDIKTGSEKFALRDAIKKQLAAYEGSPEEKLALKKELEARYVQEVSKIEADSQHDLKHLEQEMDKLKSSFFDYQIYLGTDRAFRNYWMFESLPGLFVEHNRAFAGECLEMATNNICGLAQCEPDKRKKFITQSIMKSKLNDDDRANQGIVGYKLYERLLIRGSIKALKRLSKQISNNPDENGSTNEELVLEIKKDGSLILPHQPSNSDLLMCTTDANNCPVHTDGYPGTVVWGYYNTEEELNALIESLNIRGYREKVLRETLENEKELILSHMQECPVEKLTVAAENREAALSAIVSKYQRKYESPNFNYVPGTEPNFIFESLLRENILDLEGKITVGYLGSMKVDDRDRWRKTIEAMRYEEQTSELMCWGPNRFNHFKEQSDRYEQDERKDINNEDQLEESYDDLEKLLSNENDPGYDFGLTKLGQDNDLENLHMKVRLLAKALLQVEQCIETKFLRHPFGPARDYKDKSVMLKKQLEGQKNLARWEMSVMRATSFAQVFLHYNVLYDAIQWSRSAEKIKCMICRRKGDPDMTLLCDECNRACHMYCLKPKLKEVPPGDWFCPKCHPEDYKKKKHAAVKRKIFEEYDLTVEEEISDPIIGNASTDAFADEELCHKCKEEGANTVCNTCGKFFHQGCSKNFESTPKKRWYCDSCYCTLNIIGRNNKKKKLKVSVRIVSRSRTEEVDDDYCEELEDGENEGEEKFDEDHQVQVVEERRSSRKRVSTSKQKSIIDSDDEPLARPKRSRRCTGKRSLPNDFRELDDFDDYVDEKNCPEDSDDEPLATITVKGSKSNRSTFNDNNFDLSDMQSSRRSRRIGDDLPLNSVALYTLIDDILKHPDSWPFNRPVSAKEVPDYYAVIKNPMDFAKIKSKLNMGDYKINEQMLNDVQLVFRNCDLYNTDETDVYCIGRNLERFVIKRCNDLFLPFKPSDMQKLEIANGINSNKMNGTN